MVLEKYLGIAIIAISFGTAAYYELENFTKVGFIKATESASVSRSTGKKKLTVSKNEPFRLNYAAGDIDGLKEIILYENGKQILEEKLGGVRGHYGTMSFEKLSSGEYLFELVAIDENGNERKDMAKLSVEDRLFDGASSKGIDLSFSTD